MSSSLDGVDARATPSPASQAVAAPAMLEPILCVQHVAGEGPGSIRRQLAAQGWSLRIVRLWRGEPLPVLAPASGLIVLGGPASVWDRRAYPDDHPELALIAAALERGVPFLGVCLGAQLLARVAGGRVWPGPAPEVGMGEVTLTDAGRADAALGGLPAVLPAFHFHGDSFDLPPGARLLASGSAYANQAFGLGERAYGLQFHWEASAAMLRRWTTDVASPYRLPSPAELRAMQGCIGRLVRHLFPRQSATSATRGGALVPAATATARPRAGAAPEEPARGTSARKRKDVGSVPGQAPVGRTSAAG